MERTATRREIPWWKGERHWLLAAGLLLALAARPAAAAFVVTTTADSGAGSLRDAITSANGAAGADEITFNLTGCPCTITLASTLTITDTLTITGPGASQLALDGNNAVQPILVTGMPALTLSDLTVQHGSSAGTGGGISTPADLVLTRVTLQNNLAATYGGGAWVGGTTTVTDSRFVGNTATQFDGGGLYATGALTVTGSEFIGNTTSTKKGYGGGGGLIAFNGTTISGTLFRGNTSADWGGGAYVANFADPAAVTTYTDDQFRANTAQMGGGGGLFSWFPTALVNVELSDNSATLHGGGVYGGYAGTYPLTVTGGLVQRNTAPGGAGIYSDHTITIDGTEIADNVSSNGNGGAAWSPHDVSVANATITDNIVLTGGNSGGVDTASNFTCTNSTFTGNRTLTGSGGGSGTGGTATITGCRYAGNIAANLGGGAFVIGGATVTSTQFESNTAIGNWGGGLFADQATTIQDGTFLQNASRYAGGGAAVQSSTLHVVGGSFEGNGATTGGYGGAIYCGGPTLTVDGGTFTGNTSDFVGGALAATQAVAVTGALFSGNVADADGGAIWAGTDLDLEQSQCIANQAARGGGVFHSGGAGTIGNTLFARNHATSAQGEALALVPGSTDAIKFVTIATSPTPAAGAAIWVGGGTVQLQNSIVAAHAQGVLADAGTVAADYDLFFGNTIDVQGIGASNDHPVFGDPRFVDPTHDDYHLMLGSPAIDVGPAIGVTVDFDGDMRPQGIAYDLGYDEFVLATTTTSSSTTSTSTTSTSTTSSSTSTTIPCPAPGFPGLRCQLDLVSPADVCTSPPLPLALQLYLSGKLSAARGMLQTAALRQANGAPAAAVARLLSSADRQLAAILKKTAKAAKVHGKKPAAVSAACAQSVEQQIGDVRQRLTALRGG